jgi:hypothetical protein
MTAMMRKMRLIGLMILACGGPLFGAPKEKQTQNPALVFMVAGQSNAGGCGVYSPEMHKELGRDKERPLIPGTTAAEVGLPTDAAHYTHSYIWMRNTGFERLDPMVNTRPDKRGIKMHGMELPVVHYLQRRFPDHDIYVIKHGPSGRTLFHDWNPDRDNALYARFLGYYREGMAQLNAQYPGVRVVGLYWDQGESDGPQADQYVDNLARLVARLREDCGLPALKVFIRKHLFPGGHMDTIIAAQQAVAEKDPHCYLLDIDLGTKEANFEAWAYSPGNIHLNSKAFVELARILMEDVLKNPEVGSFELYRGKVEFGGGVSGMSLLTDKEADRFQTSIARTRPYGDDTWQDREAKRLGLEHTLRREGRPRTVKVGR